MDRLKQIKKSFNDARMDSTIFGQLDKDMEWLIEQLENYKLKYEMAMDLVNTRNERIHNLEKELSKSKRDYANLVVDYHQLSKKVRTK